MSRLTVVVDNTAQRGLNLLAEHGLCLWLEHQGRDILYDTGGSWRLLKNMETLGLDPNRLQAVVLSHGHYDHGGGLEHLLEARGEPLPVWCHPAVFSPHLSGGGGQAHQVGMPYGQAAYQDMGARFNFLEAPASPWPGITLLAPIARRTSFEVIAPNLLTHEDGGLAPDPLLDDLALAVQAPGGLCVLTGCAHSGVINVLDAAQEETGLTPRLLVGGTHLGPASAGQQEAALAELARRRELSVVAGHCTGPQMITRLQAKLGQRFKPLAAGLSLEF